MTVHLDLKKKKRIWNLSWFSFLFIIREWNYSAWIYLSDAAQVLSCMKWDIFAIKKKIKQKNI